MKDQTIYIECECGMKDHLAALELSVWDRLDELPECYLHLQLKHYLPWYKRFGVALLYILGISRPNKFHFDCTVISNSDAKKMIELLQEYSAGYEAVSQHIKENM